MRIPGPQICLVSTAQNDQYKEKTTAREGHFSVLRFFCESVGKGGKGRRGKGQSGLDSDPVDLCREVFSQQSLAPSLGHPRPCPILLRDFSSCLSHHPRELEAGTASSFGGWVKSFHGAG